jgi:hypothetical protein
MGGQSSGTTQSGPSPFISAPSDPRDMPDPLIESLKWITGAGGSSAQAPQSVPKAVSNFQQAPAPMPQAQPVPPMSATASSDEYTIPPDPLIETLKWLVGSSGAKNAPKRK